jgi:rhomboid family GlyGly-CTERM serine protease
VAAAALTILFLPGASSSLVFDRLLIRNGEWWRVLTSHWVHFSPGHLFWNLAVLVPAGGWAERLQPARTRVFYVISPLLIGAALYGLEPNLVRYAGLSGMAAGALALLALAQLGAGAEDRWFWRTVLALLALKIVAEVAVASPLLAHFPDPGMRSVPLSHVAGVVAGIMALYGRRRRSGR